MQQLVLRQRLQDAEVKRGAADAATGKCQADQVVGGRSRSPDLASTAGLRDLRQLVLQNFLECNREWILRWRFDEWNCRFERCISGHISPSLPLMS